MAELLRTLNNLNLRKNNKIAIHQPNQASSFDNKKDKQSKQVKLQIANIENSLQNWFIQQNVGINLVYITECHCRDIARKCGLLHINFLTS